jgi:hypothetical protein
MLTLALSQTNQLVLIAINLIIEGEETDFGGLGKMMLGGFLLAISVAIAITFVRLRLRDSKPPAQFISISSAKKKD